MHLDWNAILTVVVAIATAVIHHAIKTPKDHEKASLIATLADDAAAVVLALNPNAPWAQLVKDVVNKLKGAATTPTANNLTLETAATAALVRLGKTPQAG
jgi:hypothetical protein